MDTCNFIPRYFFHISIRILLNKTIIHIIRIVGNQIKTMVFIHINFIFPAIKYGVSTFFY